MWGHEYLITSLENFKVMDATKSMDPQRRGERGGEGEEGRKKGREGGAESAWRGAGWDGHLCLTLSDDG